MIRLRYQTQHPIQDKRMHGDFYPMVYTEFPTAFDREEESAIVALVDSGSPVSLMPIKLKRHLRLTASTAWTPPPIVWLGLRPNAMPDRVRREFYQTWTADLVIGGVQISDLEFGLWVRGYPLLGTDVFSELFLIFDQQRRRLFVRKRVDWMTEFISRTLSRFSRSTGTSEEASQSSLLTGVARWSGLPHHSSFD